MNQQINKSAKNSKTILVIILAIALLSGMILAWQYWWISKEEVRVPEVKSTKAKGETAQCSSVDIPNYEVYANFYIDLNNDQKEELVRIYREFTEELPTLPIVVKIFSGTKECWKEVFSYQGTGNEIWSAQAFLNFWGDGANAVMVNDVSYAGGSGSSVVLRFFAYRNGKYVMIEGPQLGGYNWQCCKFDDKNPGKKIIGAESRWDPDYSDYCAGCPSRFKFFIYTWNGKEYIKAEAGTTKNKYSGNIDEILQKEPSMLTGSKIHLSTANVYFSEDVQGIFSLDLSNAEIKIIKYPYGGAPVVGAKQYAGEAILSFGESKLNLGKRTFVENTSHDGVLLVKKLNPNNDQDFIIIPQYGTSSWEMVRFYGYDFMNQSLMQYNFKYKNGKIWNEICVSPIKDNLLEILFSKDFISRGYDNSIGKFRVCKWRFNNEENIFKEVESWLEERDF